MNVELQDKEPVIVCGYPKSGNTWTARLLGEVLQSPVVGFFGEPNSPEMAREGLARKGRFAVYKAHQPQQVMDKLGVEKVIYVLRDVRDVAVSGAHYFPLRKYNNVRYKNGKPPLDKFEAMVRTLVNGGVYAHCRKPWGLHVTEYLVRPNTAVVRYEDLLRSPYDGLKPALELLGVSFDRSYVEAAAERQSFDRAKQKFLDAGEAEKAGFLRAGRSGQYKAELSSDQIERLEERYKVLLMDLGYMSAERHD